MKYNKLAYDIKKENKERRKAALRHICEHDHILRNESTDTRWKQYQDREITHAQLLNYTIARINRRYDKQLAEDLEKLERIASAPQCASIILDTTWKRSRVWGYNPTTEARIVSADYHTEYQTGTASGCGYDKYSAAIASALNNSDSALRILYDAKERARRRRAGSNHDLINYGSGYGALPYYEGGVGANTLIHILEKCGYKVVENTDHRNNSYIYMIKK